MVTLKLFYHIKPIFDGIKGNNPMLFTHDARKIKFESFFP